MSTFPLTSKEFPDFDLSTMPAIPAEWKESSYHNDIAPSFLAYDAMDKDGDEYGFVQVFIDHVEIEKREIEEGKRFCVVFSTATNCESIETNKWQTVLDYVADCLKLI